MNQTLSAGQQIKLSSSQPLLKFNQQNDSCAYFFKGKILRRIIFFDHSGSEIANNAHLQDAQAQLSVRKEEGMTEKGGFW